MFNFIVGFERDLTLRHGDIKQKREMLRAFRNKDSLLQGVAQKPRIKKTHCGWEVTLGMGVHMSDDFYSAAMIAVKLRNGQEHAAYVNLSTAPINPLISGP